MKNIVLICVTSQDVINFRCGLINQLKQDGYQVSVIAFDNNYQQEIESLGVTFRCVEGSNRSVNPFEILTLKGKYQKTIKELQPDIVFTFMLKPNTFGVLAAHSAGVKNIYSMVEGIGDAFVNNSLKWRVVRAVVSFLYKRSLRHSKRVVFLNPDDMAEFTSRGFVKKEQCMRINGIGVDLNRFEQKPLKNRNRFLMVARMLKTKGVYEYCECARRVKKLHPDTTFGYLGGEGNVTLDDIKEYIDDGSVDYYGTTKDVRPYLEDTTFLVLPSYREGLPMSIMEAESVGRGIITTNNVGCKETVSEGYNGFLVECHNTDELVEKCLYVLDNPNEAEIMCANSRTYAEKNFDSEKISKQIIEVLKS